jgi:hypothetical protein
LDNIVKKPGFLVRTASLARLATIDIPILNIVKIK